MKASHKGTCQICGNLQKLPSGRLSKHGYTVDYGWFNGVCSGAHGLPFEQSTDLIQAAVESTKASLASTLEIIEELKTTTQYVWVQHYYRRREASDYTTGHAWERHYKNELETKEMPSGSVRILYHPKKRDNETLAEVTSYQSNDGLNDAIIQQNESRIKMLARQVEAMKGYISWQEKRVAEWKPQELQAV